ncbi:metallophosphoesterase family protein [Halomontanus rarus]|uniref:metallophosphoesterase family protein n=1 Tax=Halomontanus rarus TaxID=3034020 RepID=UPI001F60AD25
MTEPSHPMTDIDIGDRLRLGRLSRPRTDEPVRIAVVGDPHVATRSNGTYRVFHRTAEQLRRVIDGLNDREIDLVLFPGDLTKDGEPWNYERVDELLDRLEHPFVALAGNHDVAKRDDEHESLTPATFADRYGAGTPPVRLEVGGLDLFVLESAAGPDGPYTETHRGRLSADQVEWLDGELEGAREPVVTCHHNPLPLVSHPLREVQPWRVFTMPDRDRLTAVLDRHDVPLVVTGHHHLPSLVRRRSLTQLIAPALASYPQAYCLLEVDDSGSDIWLVSHATSDERDEAYRLSADGPAFYRTLLGLTESTLDDLPLVHEPPEIDRSALGERNDRDF